MHNALEIVEIRQEIYKWFRMPVAWRPELNCQPGKPLRDDRGTIVNLACTCREFNNELMPILWRKLPTIRYILKLVPQYREPLPEILDDKRQPGTFDTDSLSTGEILRYVHYAKYVEELGWNIRFGPPFKGQEGYQILLDAIPSSLPRFLLPSLRSLHIYGTGYDDFVVLPSFFASFPSLTCLDFLGYGQIKDLFGLHGCSRFDAVYHTPFNLTKICLRQFPVSFPEEIIFLVRNSPCLTHLLLPDSTLEERLADEVIDVGLRLVAILFECYETKALAKLLDFVAPSLQWLMITDSATTDGEEVLLKTNEFPALRELYFLEHQPSLCKLGNLLKPRLPALRALSIEVDRAPLDKGHPPKTLAILQEISVEQPTLWSQVTSLFLTIESWLFGDEEGTSWGNNVLSLFPNLENLTISIKYRPTFISKDMPLIHSNLRHLTLICAHDCGDYFGLMQEGGSLRALLPRLETLSFDSQWMSEEYVSGLAEVPNSQVKIFLWEDETVHESQTSGNLEVATAGLDV